MHRIASQPGEDTSQNLTLIEQPSAEIIFLTSAESDITTLSNVIKSNKNKNWHKYITAINISNLANNAVVDHYISTTCTKAKIVIIRLLGSRSQWSYGIEQFMLWRDNTKSHLLVLSGTKDNELELNGLGSIEYNLSIKLGELLRFGGIDNTILFINIISKIIDGKIINIENIKTNYLEDPYLYKWENKKGTKVAILVYSSYYQCGDYLFVDKIRQTFIQRHLVPRVFFVKSLKDTSVQKKIIDIIKVEKIKILITTTSFSFDNNVDGFSFFNILTELNIPTIQLLISTRSKDSWIDSSRGLNPTDLSLQVVLPEIDGRITTRIIAFREKLEESNYLSTPVYKTEVHSYNLNWCMNLIESYINLSEKDFKEVKVALIISNYPISDGRIGNGVGLDTPSSIVNILRWMKDEGYDLGSKNLPRTSNELMNLILNGRTNTQESSLKKPICYLSKESYLNYWETLPKVVKQKIIEKWDMPLNSSDLEKDGFPINGIRFGKVILIIQPSRGYTDQNIKDLHSPYLPPSHKYLSTYNWIYKKFKCDCIVHVGKHGTAEWLPGKAVALSENCFPHIVIPPIPHIYPFIVNDPGEGTQAKRRTQAVIIDHLTPPVSRSGTYGYLEQLEILLDEYHECNLLNSKRTEKIKENIISIITSNKLSTNIANKDKYEIDKIIGEVESYICEIKESQIRTGLHILGRKPKPEKLADLILAIALSPSYGCVGLSQSISSYLGFEIDPWNSKESTPISSNDIEVLKKYDSIKLNINGKLVTWINDIAKTIIIYLIQDINHEKKAGSYFDELDYYIRNYINNQENKDIISRIKTQIIPKVVLSSTKEKEAFLNAIKGGRITSGPSGSPTRGKIEVLPTGRNFYSLDLRGLPTQAAWDLGRRSAENILELHKLETGNDLTNLALSVWGTSTMRNGGEDISQMLALMGVMPVWDARNLRIIDIDVIPLSVLKRPRVDVTLRISGLFRDTFPNLIELVNQALRIISNLKEPFELNPLAAYRSKNGKYGRIYGSAPETYGTGIQELINTGVWENSSDIANTYLDWSNWLYNDSDEPLLDDEGLKNCLRNIQVVIHNRDNNEHDILDSDDYYQFHGGIFNAVKELSGKKPIIYFGDHSKYSKPTINTLKKEIDKVVRNRILNPKWLESMKEHGYKGAFEMSASIDYLFAYDATTNQVSNWAYTSINETWLADKDTIEFLKNNNRWALRDIAERLLEAHNRDLWTNATKDEINKLKNIVLTIEREIEC